MISILDKKTLFIDKYQALIMPVPVSGIFRHRLQFRVQQLYPDFYQTYKQACEHGELQLGQNLISLASQDVAGMGVSGAVAKPKFVVAMAITEFAETPPHLPSLTDCLQQLENVVFDWGRYDGMRRVAMIGVDELILPKDCTFETDILPLLEKYLQTNSKIHLVIYR